MGRGRLFRWSWSVASQALVSVASNRRPPTLWCPAAHLLHLLQVRHLPPSPPSPPSTSHYEKPPCQSDEVQAEVQGAGGSVCAPHCDTGSCPSDVPSGTTAHPMCILQDSSSGDKYCALACILGGCPSGSKCVHLSSLLGICVYPDAESPVTLALANSEITVWAGLPSFESGIARRIHFRDVLSAWCAAWARCEAQEEKTNVVPCPSSYEVVEQVRCKQNSFFSGPYQSIRIILKCKQVLRKLPVSYLRSKYCTV